MRWDSPSCGARRWLVCGLMAASSATLACTPPEPRVSARARPVGKGPTQLELPACPGPAPEPAGRESPRSLIQGRHTAAVVGLAFSHGGKLASASSDGSIRVWDVVQRVQWMVHRSSELGEPTAAGWIDEDLLAAYVFGNQRVRLSGETLAGIGQDAIGREHGLSGPLWPLPDGGWLTTYGWLDARGRWARLGVKPPANGMPSRMGVAGGAVAAAGNGWVARWNAGALASEPGVATIDGSAFAAVPVGTTNVLAGVQPRSVAAWRRGGEIREVNTATGASRLLVGGLGMVHDLALSSDGTLAVGATTHELTAFELTTGNVRYRHQSPGPFREFRVAAFSHNDRWLAAGTSDGAVLVFDAASGHFHGELGAAVRFPQLVRFSGAELTVGSSGRISRWSLTDGGIAARTDVTGIAAAVRTDGDIVALEVDEHHPCPLFVTALAARALSPAATRGASWPPATPVTRCVELAGYPGIIDFDAERGRVLVDTGSALFVYDLVADRRIDIVRPRLVTARLTRNGRHVVGTLNLGIAPNGRMAIWDAQSGTLVGEHAIKLYDGSTCAHASALSADGTQVAVSCGSMLWQIDRKSGKHTEFGGAAAEGIAQHITALAFDAGGRLIVGWDDGSLELHESGAAAVRRYAGGGAVIGIEPSPDRQRIASVGADGGVRLLSSALELRATFVEFADDEHIAFTPGGAYAGTSEVAERVGWVYRDPFELFRFEQFAGYRDQAAVRRRLAGSGADARPVTSRPPRVERVDLSGRAGTHARLKVHARSPSRVKGVLAYVEGRPVAVMPVCAPERALELSVPLLPGRNRIALLAVDDEGYSSNLAFVDVDRPLGGSRPRLWVVALGVSAYPKLGAKFQLDLADDDARAIAAAFGKLTGSGQPFEHASTTVLTDAEVTVDRVRAALDGLARMSADDVAIVSFAGHGIKLRESADMVLLTGEVRGGPKGGVDEKSLGAASIGWPEIGERLARAKGRVIVLLDACHSGHVTQELLVPNEALVRALSHQGRAGVVVFSASKGRQLSYEGGARRGLELDDAAAAAVGGVAGHGFFTGALLASLDSADTDLDRDGMVQLSELIDAVTQRVMRASQGKQTPWLARRELFGDFAIAAAR